MPDQSQAPTQQGRNDARDLLLLLAYAEKLQETQQHLDEVCSLMQQKVPLEGLISAQDNRTLQAANRCLKSLHVRVEALANVMEQTVTAQQLQFMHEMAQSNCRQLNDTDHNSEEPKVAAHATSCKSNWLDLSRPSCFSQARWLHITQCSRVYSNSPVYPRHHGRVPVVGHPNQSPYTSSNRHGRVPVVGFSTIWLAMVRHIEWEEIINCNDKEGTYCSNSYQWVSTADWSNATLSTVNDIPHYTSAQPSPATRNSQDPQDDCQSTHERTLRGGRLFCHFSLCMSHHSFTFFFTRPAYRLGRCAMVPVMPARLHHAISGILAGRILGFGMVTLLLWHPTAHPVIFVVSFVLCLTDGLLGTGHTSCLVTPLFTAARYDVYIPLIASPLVFWCFFVLCLFGCWSLVFCLCVVVLLVCVLFWGLMLTTSVVRHHTA